MSEIGHKNGETCNLNDCEGVLRISKDVASMRSKLLDNPAFNCRSLEVIRDIMTSTLKAFDFNTKYGAALASLVDSYTVKVSLGISGRWTTTYTHILKIADTLFAITVHAGLTENIETRYEMPVELLKVDWAERQVVSYVSDLCFTTVDEVTATIVCQSDETSDSIGD